MTFDHPARNVLHALERLGGDTERGIGFLQGAGDECFYTYAEFFQMVRSCLTGLRETGMLRGDEVILQVEDTRSFLLIFWACLAGGMIPIPLSAGEQAEHKRKTLKVWEQLDNPWLIGTPTVIKEISPNIQDRFLDITRILELADKSEPSDLEEPDGIAYIQYSSGSTGSPKGVVLTHANLCANVEAILSRSRTTHNDSMLSWMPLTHDMGMICFHLCGVFAGISQYIMPTALFIRRPLLWIQTASDKQITQLYSPDFGLQFFLLAFKKVHAINWDLSAVRIIYNGAEQISEKVCKQFTEALGIYGLRTNSIFPGYGLAEASVAVALPDPGDALTCHVIRRSGLQPGQRIQFCTDEPDQTRLVEVGYPVPDCALRITHAGKTLKEGFLGAIEIKGKNVTQGYYRSPDLAKEIFSGDGWLKTGDLGFLINGRLVIAGRSKNMIIRNGLNYFPHDLERILLAIPGVQAGNLVVASCWDPSKEKELVAVFVNFRQPLVHFLTLQQEIHKLLLAEAGIIIDDIIPVKKIPKTTSGKIQHFRLTEAYLKGEYDLLRSELGSLSDSTPGGMEEQIRKVCGKWLPSFSWDADFQLSGLNSLQMVRLVNELEAASGKHITIADLFRFNSPGRLLDHLRYKATVSEQIPAITPVALKTDYPALLSQRKMWFIEQTPERRGVFNISFILALAGKANAEKIGSTFQELLRRHDSLRTCFIWREQELRQEIAALSDITCVEWRSVTSEDKESAVRMEANTGFDLSKAPLIRVIVWQDTRQEDELQVTIHHTITDGWSIQILLNEFSTLYFSPHIDEPLPLPELQFRDYSSWYGLLTQSPFSLRAGHYWIEKFRQGFSPMQLPFHHVARRSSFKKEVVRERLDAAFVQKTDLLAGNKALSRFSILLSLLHSLFYRYTRQQSIVTGVEVANRAHPASASIVGPLINTVLLRSTLFQDMSLEDLACQLQDQMLEGMEFEAYSIDHLEELFQEQQIDHPSPLFNTLIIYHNFSRLLEGPLLITDHRIRTVETDNALCDLLFEFFEDGNELLLKVHYDTGMFEGREIGHLMESFRILSAQLINAPHKSIGQAQLLSDQEVQRQLYLARGPHADRSIIAVPDLIKGAIDAYPDNVAITCGSREVTYRELDIQINTAVRRLIDEYDARPGMFIAVVTSVSDQSIILMLAIWRIGCVYVPIDPTLPQHRIQHILNDSHPGIIIADPIDDWRVMDEWKTVDCPRGAACVIYTSGTTGYPKGIVISQDSLSDYIQTFTSFFGVTDQDVVVQQASINFDISLEEILPVLSKGGKVVIASGGGRDIHALLDLIGEEQVTILSSTPAVIREINFIDPPLNSLRLLISGGERLERNHIDKLSTQGFRIYNTYGPAEITICATYHLVQEGGLPVSLGRPIDNREVYILDGDQQLVPFGETGEVCIGGKGLALCYLNEPELTAEKFISHPFNEGELLYRSGDLGRWLPSHDLEFIGRLDHQVKIRGYRVECEEISQVIDRTGNCQSVVIPVQESTGEYYLSAYVSGITPSDLDNLRTALPSLLPDFMLPAAFTLMEALPVNANGKIDRNKLPKAYKIDLSERGGTPETATQKTLALIWQEILKVDRVGLHSDFLRLGGHSLKIVRLISRIDNELHVRLSLRNVFELPVLEQMAGFVDGLIPVQSQSIHRIPAAQDYELSHAQRRLWILDRLYPGNTAYNIVVAHSMSRWPGMDRLKQVLLWLVERHESLRTVFTINGDHPRQIVRDPGMDRITMYYKDWRSEPDMDTRIADVANEESACHFDFFEGPLARIHIMQCSDDRFIILFNIHHIVCDGWSMEVIMKELMLGIGDHGSISSYTPMPLQYRDYAAWQAGMADGHEGHRMKERWKDVLNGELPVLSLPADHERPAMKSFRGDVLYLTIPDEIWAGLRSLRQQEQTSIYTALLAAVFILLHKESGQTDILVGTATAGRDHIELEGQVGVFANTLPIRTIISDDASFRSLIRSIHQYILDTHDIREYPFDRLIEDLGIERDLSRYPMFDVLVNYDDRQIYQQYSREFQLEPLHLPQSTSKFDLTFHFEEAAQLTLRIEYALDLFRESTIRRYFSHFLTILHSITANPDSHISKISLLDPEEALLTSRFNDTSWSYPVPKPLNGIFTDQAMQTPDRTALVCNGVECSYRFLNERSDRLAGFLQAEFGVSRGDRVILLMDHSIEMMVALLAVLKAGAAYVPVGIDYPDERVLFVAEDTQPALTITNRIMPDPFPCKQLFMPEMDLDGIRSEYVPADHDMADAAYIIYTSGSTGEPKGVVIRHFSVINLLSWLTDQLKIETGGSLLSISSYTFDISVLEYCLPWFTGGTLILSTQAERKDPARLVKMLAHYDPDIFQSTPSLLSILVREGWKGSDKLVVISGGETLQKELAIKLTSISKALYNMYGPTETTIYSSIYPVTPAVERIYIGKPVGNTGIYILDRHRQLLPVGVVGEICISGDGVAAGYHNRPLLNQERFIDHPFEPGKKLYLTGDLGRWTGNGDIEFLGRRDTQVKINGYRIECGEIEKAIAKAGVAMAVVLPVEDIVNGRYLAAYLQGVDETRLAAVKERLLTMLPVYMMPTAWILMEALPLNTNGKADRKLLADCALNPDTAPQAPESPIRGVLSGIWQEILSVEQIGMDDDFFRLGGHSIAALKIINTVNKQFNVNFTIRDIFLHNTLRKMTGKLEMEGNVLQRSIPIAPKASYYPLSHSQYRLWLLNLMRPGNPAYNLPVTFRLDGLFHPDLFIKAIQSLIARHDILRTRFVWLDGQPWQDILPVHQCKMDVQVEIMDAEDMGEALAVLMEQEAAYSFDLEKAPLLKLRILRMAAQTHLIALNIHHIICDAWSIEIMLKELSGLYTSLSDDPEIQPAPLAFQYKDFSTWQRSAEQQTALARHAPFWRDLLLDAGTAIAMPVDRPRLKHGSAAGERYSWQFSTTCSNRLKQLAADHDASLFMILLTLIKILLAKYSGQRDLVIGTAVAGRDFQGLEQQVGFYVNTIPVRTSVDWRLSFGDLLTAVKERMLAVFQHQEYPLDLMIEGSILKMEDSRSNIFDVVVNYQSAEHQLHFTLPGLKVDTLFNSHSTSKFDLIFDIAEGEEIKLTTEYNTDIFERRSVERLISHLQHLAEQACDDPGRPLQELMLTTQAEQLKILQVFNQQAIACPAEDTVLSLFMAQVQSSPDALALVGEKDSLSYQELNRASNRIGRYLAEECGIVPGDRVALVSDRSIPAILWILSILKVGGIYVPIDGEYPEARMALILEDTGAKLAITDRLRRFESKVRAIEMTGVNDSAFSSDDLDRRVWSEDIAYIMYTSGSTGRPKGVPISHHNIARLVRSQNYIRVSTIDRLLLTGSLSFDATTFEIWGMLLNGGQLHLLAKASLMDIQTLKTAIRERGITTMWFTASWFNQLAERDAHLFEPLRTLLVGGDKLSAPHIEKVRHLFKHIRIVNGYGPTEATTFSTYHEVTDTDILQGTIPIGRPLSDVQVYILDDLRHLQPVGVIGEIYIGGDGLSKGYWNEAELTERRFVVHPFREGGRLYRSGDLGCWTEDGAILFKGRADDQVKVRGYRVECGEVEYAMQQAGGQQVMVIPFDDPQHDGTYLTAYVTGIPVEERTAFRLRIQSELPAYMLPSVIMYMDSFPVNSNGKTDRSKLPMPEGKTVGQQYSLPETELQAVLISLWEELLGIKGIGPDDNFFDLGGHSLKAIRLSAMIADRLGLKPDLRDIFTNPVLRNMAARFEQAGSGGREIKRAPHMDGYPLSFNQYSLWIAGQKVRDRQAYNIMGAYKLNGSLNSSRLIRAFGLLVERHEGLRTVFRLKNGEIRQYILDVDQVPAVLNYDWCKQPDRMQSVSDLITRESAWAFDLSMAPLLRIHVIQVEDDQIFLVINMHHIIADGWSLDTMRRDILQYYHELTADPAFIPAPLHFQYKDFAYWQTEWLNSDESTMTRDFWLRQFAEGVIDLDLSRLCETRPLDRSQAGQIPVDLDPLLAGSIQDRISGLHITHYIFFLVSWHVLLYRLTHQRKFVIASPVADRDQHFMDQIGYYVNTILINAVADDDMTVKGVLSDCRHAMIEMTQHREYPFSLLVEQMRDHGLPVTDSVFSVGFSWFTHEEHTRELPGVEVTTVNSAVAFPKSRLWLSGFSSRGNIQFILTYDPSSIADEVAGLLVRRWVKVMEAFIQWPDASIGDLDIRLEEELTLENTNNYQEVAFDF